MAAVALVPRVRASLLIIESAVPLQRFLRLHLETAGFEVTLADELGAAERVIAQAPPAVILAGSAKGGIDPLQVLERMRSLLALASTPVIVVSLRGDPQTVREAEVLGAADYLVVPVTREALLSAVRRQLGEAGGDDPEKRAVALPRAGESGAIGTASASDLRRQRGVASTLGVGEHMRFLDGPAPGGGSAPPKDEGSAPPPTVLATQEARHGTVLLVHIRNFSRLAATLRTEELAEVLNSYFVRACEPILQQGGWVVKLVDDGIVALFEPRPRGPSHAERALKAGLFICIVAQRFGDWLNRRFSSAGLPAFAVGVGVHAGDLLMCRINTGAGVETSILGDTVDIAVHLQEQTQHLGASVVTSLDTLALAGSRFIPGRRGSLTVRGHAVPVEITEITGLRPRADVDAEGLQTYHLIAEAVEHNARFIERERSRVPSHSHRARPGSAAALLLHDETPVEIPGFKLLRLLDHRIASRAFLAEYRATGSLRVLKVLNRAALGSDRVQRFLTEHELIAQVRDPHIAAVFDTGQTDTHAYVVMEYLSGGDLRSLMGNALSPERALDYLYQIAMALAAIHARGIVHRHLQPCDLMLRDEVTLVLANFGIVEDPGQAASGASSGMGSRMPYYLSPEQGTGGAGDQRSDLYSLGVMLFEMLTGSKPYTADDAASLIHQHVHEPVPWLPDEVMPLQPLIDRLMAKSPDDRFATSSDALKAIRTVCERQSDTAAAAPREAKA